MPFPSPGDLPNPGIKPGSLELQTIRKREREIAISLHTLLPAGCESSCCSIPSLTLEIVGLKFVNAMVTHCDFYFHLPDY